MRIMDKSEFKILAALVNIETVDWSPFPIEILAGTTRVYLRAQGEPPNASPVLEIADLEKDEVFLRIVLRPDSFLNWAQDFYEAELDLNHTPYMERPNPKKRASMIKRVRKALGFSYP